MSKTGLKIVLISLLVMFFTGLLVVNWAVSAVKDDFLKLEDLGRQSGEHNYIEFSIRNPLYPIIKTISADFEIQLLDGDGVKSLRYSVYENTDYPCVGWELESFFEPINGTTLQRSKQVASTCTRKEWIPHTLQEVIDIIGSNSGWRKIRIESDGWNDCVPIPGSTACLQRVDVIPIIAGFSFPEFVIWENIMDSWSGGIIVDVTATDTQPATLGSTVRTETAVDAKGTMAGLWQYNNDDPSNMTFLRDYAGTNHGTGLNSWSDGINFVSTGDVWVNYSTMTVNTTDGAIGINFNIISGDGTFCTWFNMPAQQSGIHKIMGRGDEAQTGWRRLFIGGSAQTLSIDFAGGCTETTITSDDFELGAWHLGCYEVNTTGSFLYLDGVQNASSTNCANFDAGDTMKIGDDVTGSHQTFNGSLDDSIWWDAPIGAANILELYNDGAEQFPALGSLAMPSFCDVCNDSKDINWTNIYFNTSLPTDTEITIDLSFSDDNLTWADNVTNVTSGDMITNISATYIQWVATFLPNPGRTSTPSLTNVTISFEYQSTNTAPSFNAELDDQEIFEDTVVTHDMQGNVTDTEDADSDLGYIVESSNTVVLTVSVVNSTGVITYTAVANQTGAVNVSVIVVDTGGLAAQDSQTMTVNGVNDVPQWVADLREQEMSEDTPVPQFFQPNYTDVEDADSALGIIAFSNDTTIISGFTIDNSTGNVNVTLVADANGVVNVSYLVVDSGGLSSQTFQDIIVVAVNDIPQPPTGLTANGTVVRIDQTFTLSWTNGSDVDGDSLTYGLELSSGSDFTNIAYFNYSITEVTSTTVLLPANIINGTSTVHWRIWSNDGTTNSTFQHATLAYQVDVTQSVSGGATTLTEFPDQSSLDIETICDYVRPFVTSHVKNNQVEVTENELREFVLQAREVLPVGVSTIRRTILDYEVKCGESLSSLIIIPSNTRKLLSATLGFDVKTPRISIPFLSDNAIDNLSPFFTFAKDPTPSVNGIKIWWVATPIILWGLPKYIRNFRRRSKRLKQQK